MGRPLGLRYALLHMVFLCSSQAFDWESLDLPESHLPFVLSHHPSLAEACIKDTTCPYQLQASKSSSKCWGYEKDCKKNNSYSNKRAIKCASHQQKEFWTRADFGFVKNILKETRKISICSPKHENDSSLICSRNARYCHAKNIYLDFQNHNPENDRFKANMFEEGMIGGHCELYSKVLKQQGEHPYPLQSWYSELQNYTRIDFQSVPGSQNCDIYFDKPTIFMKLDSGVNIYHHFCDFFNLYLSQHVNNSWFDKDIQVVMWDTSSLGYFDIVNEAWKAFTDHPLIKLKEFVGKRVCFREAMFPLLPRMRGGLYYNTYIPEGCVGSSLFRSFSEHFLHRMKVKQHSNDDRLATSAEDTEIKITLLQRGNPENERVFRQIKNQDELVKVIEEFEGVKLKVVEYDWRKISFAEQLDITHNSDVFIGMHGAGLLHFLFLPDWAIAFELYNCDDAGCYYDLARLRGLDYITWGNGKLEAFDKGKHKRYGDNPKFWNWSFDPDEFRKLMKKALDLVRVNKKSYKTANNHDEL